MKSSLLFVLIVLSLSQKVNSQNSEEIEILLNILECMDKENKLNKTIINQMRNNLNNYNPYNLQKVYEFMEENLDNVNSCTDNMKDIPDYMKRYIIPFNKRFKEFDWDLYLNCINNHPNKDDSLNTLISFIKEKNYYDAIIEELRLVGRANLAVLHCYYKKNENIIHPGVFIGDEFKIK